MEHNILRIYLLLNNSPCLLMFVRTSSGRLPLTEPNHVSRRVSETSTHSPTLTENSQASKSAAVALERYARSDTSSVTAQPPINRHISSRSRFHDTNGRSDSNFVDLTMPCVRKRSDTSESGVLLISYQCMSICTFMLRVHFSCRCCLDLMFHAFILLMLIRIYFSLLSARH